MSFKCDYCDTPQPAGTKLNLVTPADCWRDAQYTRKNQETGLVEVVGLGRESVAQFKVCRTCLELEPLSTPAPVDLKPFLRMTNGYVLHVQKCPGYKSIKKRDPLTGDEVKEQIPCRICELIIRDYGQFPLAVLSQCIEDYKPRPFKTPLGIVAAGNVAQFMQNGKQSQRDVAAGLKWLGEFEGRNPNFIRI